MRASQGHPDGRFIDGNAGKGMPNTGAQPGESPAVAMGNLAWPPEKNATECRYGVRCKRVGCYFKHPEGRQIDKAESVAMVDGGRSGSVETNGSNAGKTGVDELTKGFSSLSTESEKFSLTTQELQDTWFPKAKDCDCCKGFIYGCTNDICRNLNMCMCQVKQSDLDQTEENVSITPLQDQ